MPLILKLRFGRFLSNSEHHPSGLSQGDVLKVKTSRISSFKKILSLLTEIFKFDRGWRLPLFSYV